MSRLLRDVFTGEDSKASGWDGVLYKGSVVGRFELVREVGHGGFGTVWVARDRELKRRVAFKAIHRVAGEKPDNRTVAEAEVAAHLSHPNVVTLFDVGRSEQGAYLVMEFLEGETLSKLLRHGPLSPEDAVRIAAQVARGLAHAHGRGVLHRDLAPSNVFVCDDGTVKLLESRAGPAPRHGDAPESHWAEPRGTSRPSGSAANRTTHAGTSTGSGCSSTGCSQGRCRRPGAARPRRPTSRDRNRSGPWWPGCSRMTLPEGHRVRWRWNGSSRR